MRVTLSAFVLCLASTTALAADETNGNEILAKADKQLNAFTDGTFESKLVMKQADGTSREYGFTTFQKNPDKRLVRFSSPGDVKGMGVLIENAETMYVYLPGFQRIRRMGTHIRNQTFMGSDFGFDDMATLSFGAIYEGKLVGTTADQYELELTAKIKDIEYSKLKMWVNKDHFTMAKVEYYDAGGKKVKTQIRDGYKQDSPEHYQPGRVAIIDHRRNDHTSEILFLSSKLNTKLSDDIFTQRALIRGN